MGVEVGGVGGGGGRIHLRNKLNLRKLKRRAVEEDKSRKTKEEETRGEETAPEALLHI